MSKKRNSTSFNNDPNAKLIRLDAKPQSKINSTNELSQVLCNTPKVTSNMKHNINSKHINNHIGLKSPKVTQSVANTPKTPLKISKINIQNEPTPNMSINLVDKPKIRNTSRSLSVSRQLVLSRSPGSAYATVTQDERIKNKHNEVKIATSTFYKQSKNDLNKSTTSQDTHALVQWQDKSFTVVELKQIRRAANQGLELDETYDVKYGRELYKADLKIIGTLEYCSEQCSLLTNYEQANTNLTCVTNSNQVEETNTEIVALKNELDLTKNKLEELTVFVEEKDNEIKNLLEQLQQQECLNESLKETFSIEMTDKFLSMSKTFLQLFGSEKDLDDLEFIEGTTYITSKYPMVKVSKQLRTELDNLLNNETNTNSMVFRRVIQTLLPEEEIWANGNREIIFEKYKEIIYAAFTYVCGTRTAFTLSKCNGLITQICAESRRKMKKKSSDFKNSSVELTVDPCDELNGDECDGLHDGIDNNTDLDNDEEHSDTSSLAFDCGSDSSNENDLESSLDTN